MNFDDNDNRIIVHLFAMDDSIDGDWQFDIDAPEGDKLYDALKHNDDNECIEIQLPVVDKLSTAWSADKKHQAFILTIDAYQPSIDNHILSSRVIYLKEKPNLAFLNTDKAVYSQGDLVNFRILVLNSLLQKVALLDNADGILIEELEIINPDDRKLLVRRNKRIDGSQYEDSFLLADNAQVGSYKFKAKIAFLVGLDISNSGEVSSGGNFHDVLNYETEFKVQYGERNRTELT